MSSSLCVVFVLVLFLFGRLQKTVSLFLATVLRIVKIRELLDECSGVAGVLKLSP